MIYCKLTNTFLYIQAAHLIYQNHTPQLSLLVSVWGLQVFKEIQRRKCYFVFSMLWYLRIQTNDRGLMYRKQYHLIIEQMLSRKSSENALQYNPLANNICIIWFWIIHRVKRPRGISQHEFSITNRSCKNIMKNICQNAIWKMEAVSKW